MQVGDRVRLVAKLGQSQPGDLGTLQQPSPGSLYPFRFHPLDGKRSFPIHRSEVLSAPEQFVPAVGQKVTCPGWGPNTYLTVEWVGGKTFAGQKAVYDTDKDTHELTERISASHGHGNASWQKWVQPARTYPFPFMVGDTVRYVRPNGNDTPLSRVRIAKVTPDTDESFQSATGQNYLKVPLGGHWEIVPQHPFKVGDKVQHRHCPQPFPQVVSRTYFRDGAAMVDFEKHDGQSWTWRYASQYEPYVEPEPVRKTWTVTTEERLPKKGEFYVDPIVLPLAVDRARTDFHHISTHVVVSVKENTES